MTDSPLAVLQHTVEIHHVLRDLRVGHAVGGALAMAYYVPDPRSTHDIDLNITLTADRARIVIEALPHYVQRSDYDIASAERDGQVRLWIPYSGISSDEPIPLDLFFAEDDYHTVVASRVEMKAMLNEEVPVISATDLVVFKILYNRSKDWQDLEQIIRGGKADLDEAARWIGRLVGQDDDRIRRLDSLLDEVVMERQNQAPTFREAVAGRSRQPPPICGAPTASGRPCQNTKGSCHHHRRTKK